MSLEEIAAQVGSMANAWENFKQVNDARLKEIEKKGAADPLLTGQLEKMNSFMDETKAALDEAKKRDEELRTAMNRAALGEGKDSKGQKPELVEYKKAFNDYLRKGAGRDYALDDLQTKALSVASDPDGGYLVTPEMSDSIVTRVFDTSPIRQIASTQVISTDALEGLRDVDQVSSGWVAERGARSETNTPQLGVWRIPVHELYANPYATQKLLDDSNIDAEGWLSTKIADKFGRDENTAFVVGSGAGQPQGFTSYATAATDDASRAWGTLQHINTGVNGDFAASTPADILFDLISRFKAPYLANASFVTNRAVIGRIRRFKESTTNAYIWQPGLQAGQPDRLLGYPIVMAEDMPALATGSLSLALGDFRQGYQIVDRQGIRILRDPFSAKPFVQFYATKRVGGAVVQFECIKFVRFA